MKCANCQSEVNPDDRFCTECGQRVESSMPQKIVASSTQTTSSAPTQGLREVRRFEGHRDDVIKVSFSTDGRRAFSASRDGDVYIWDLESARSSGRVLGSGSTSAVDFSADGARALCASSDLSLIDLANARPQARFERLGFINAVAFLPEGRSAAYGHRDNSIRVIEIASGKEIKRLEGQKSQSECLACSPDGRFLVSGRVDAYDAEDVVLVWDLTNTKPAYRPERLMTLVSCITFSPDSRYALTGTMDSTVYLWEVVTGREVQRYQGHTGNVLCVAFAPTGRFFVSGSGVDAYDADLIKELGIDNTLRVWDPKTGNELARGSGHERNVQSIAISPNSRYVLSGSTDRTVRLWALPENIVR